MPNFNDMSGKKIGMLTVDKFSHRSKNKDVHWECICDCGNRPIIKAYTLQQAEKKNKNINCGCVRLPIVDLTGEKFNRLLVKNFSHIDDVGTWWNCVCDCGNTKLAKSNSLKSGNIKSCGCLKKEKEVEITNQKFGRLTAIRKVGNYQNQSRWECVCECGTVKDYALYPLVSGKTQSCGCLQRELTIARSTKHGHSTREDMTDTYVIWCGIKARCFNPNEPAYKNYGARGITMCDRWNDSFENFLEDMGERPSKKHSIDRIDNEKGYEPGNCKWATRKEQSRNNRRNVWYEYNGKKMVLNDWAKEYNIPQKTLWYRLRQAGWTIEKALHTPVLSQTKDTPIKEVSSDGVSNSI